MQYVKSVLLVTLEKAVLIMIDEKISEMLSLRSNGMTYQQIGDKFGISKQRVHQLLGKQPKKQLSLENAIKYLKKEYEYANCQKWVRNPIAYALHQVWKVADNLGGDE